MKIFERQVTVEKKSYGNHNIFIRYCCSFIFSWMIHLPFASAMESNAVKHIYDLPGSKDISLNLPSDIAIAPDGRIYVVDGGQHRIVIFKSNGKVDEIIGTKGSEKGQFLYPIGIAIDNEGQVYVADSGNNRIQIFDDDEDFVREFIVKEGDRKIKPVDIAISNDRKTLYVTGNNNHKVMLFDSRGKSLGQWGKQGNSSGEFRYPATIAVGKDNKVYVVDVLNSRVQIFEPDGSLHITAGEWGVKPGQLFRPKGVALDQKDNVYISDSYLDVIQVFNNETRFIYVLGENGNPAKFVAPTGIAIDSKNRIYVTEMLANKISVYQIK
ncbi:MAG: NHL repeat-containing protein [Gammaproteobacteria bacterium]|nr:NHL repeat-containing protein [Gammaproteobacteria bacterium]MDH5630166.1 NHL repeat-containing protein [Gammaproteobacteria bacterium]